MNYCVVVIHPNYRTAILFIITLVEFFVLPIAHPYLLYVIALVPRRGPCWFHTPHRWEDSPVYKTPALLYVGGQILQLFRPCAP